MVVRKNVNGLLPQKILQIRRVLSSCSRKARFVVRRLEDVAVLWCIIRETTIYLQTCCVCENCWLPQHTGLHASFLPFTYIRALSQRQLPTLPFNGSLLCNIAVPSSHVKKMWVPDLENTCILTRKFNTQKFYNTKISRSTLHMHVHNWPTAAVHVHECIFVHVYNIHVHVHSIGLTLKYT